MSPQKRDKALVPAQRILLIRAILMDPNGTAVGTAQFRYGDVKQRTSKSAEADLHEQDFG